MNVIDYVTEEVQRQGHDTDIMDGIERVAWMLTAWMQAIRGESMDIPITRDIIVGLGSIVEPHKNANGLRRVQVRVGNRLCPDHNLVPTMLTSLVENGNELTPLEWYRKFELIHPFVDGNGRTGKILLNWRAGTLLNPFFPPGDFWGVPIINP